MARLFLVRHGQAGAVDGDYDKLSPTGERQAELLGQYFQQRQLRFGLAQSGTLQRQRQTLDIALSHCSSDQRAAPDPALNELPFQDLARIWAAQQNPPPIKDPLSGKLADILKSAIGDWINNVLIEPPLSWNKFQSDALQWLESTRQQHHSANDMLVVSSGGTIGTIMTALVDAPDLSMLRFNLQLRNTAICEIQLSPRRAHLTSFNSLPHLDLLEGGKLVTLI